MHKAVIALVCLPLLSYAQEKPENTPAIQDLNFFVGTWEISSRHFDGQKAEETLTYSEKGTKECFFDEELKLESTSAYLVCINRTITNKGRSLTVKTFENYNGNSGAFERLYLLPHWPEKIIEKLTFDPDTRTLEARGSFDTDDEEAVYAEYTTFNEDYSQYTRKSVVNYPDMAIDHFNVVYREIGTKVK